MALFASRLPRLGAIKWYKKYISLFKELKRHCCFDNVLVIIVVLSRTSNKFIATGFFTHWF